ncbi:hypothetical protein C3F09_11135 [candidate division GN15 bacterium]|uniref:Uncharacterized protein n=1 Tax=candidate division GN15 bacterium TaxID=2072418 RepID=A0A855WVQ8_9BACT|nr:MAG: hypothetical protein C3F09_11135 [candidate division GN15 bacterium]
MGISQEILSEAALNVVGYLLAGALLTLLYSSLTNRGHKKVATQPAAQTAEKPATTGLRKVEFVDLRAVPAVESRPSNRTSIDTQSRQRNRAEVMRLAREMLASGTPRENVRNLLPISEGEIALLEKQRA